jgi:hypothetical protein
MASSDPIFKNVQVSCVSTNFYVQGRGKGNNVIQDFFHNLTRPCISFYRYKKPGPTDVPSFKASYAFVEGSVEEGEVEPKTNPWILMAKIAWKS